MKFEKLRYTGSSSLSVRDDLSINSKLIESIENEIDDEQIIPTGIITIELSASENIAYSITDRTNNVLTVHAKHYQ